MSKRATNHDYLSITFGARGATDRPEAAVIKLIADLMTMHPELGGPHLVFWERLPHDSTQAQADRARAFARDYLANITKTRGTHKLYVGSSEVDDSRVIVWILRDDCDPRDLDLDETAIAREIQNAYGGQVTFLGDDCK